MTHVHLPRRRCPRAFLPGVRSAYTLIELLIASVLVAALMSVVWGMMSMYNSYLTAGQAQAAEQQLVRSLDQLLRDDLQAVSVPRGASAPQRPVAVIPGQPELIGTRNALRVTARRSVPRRSPDDAVPAESGRAGTLSGETEPPAGSASAAESEFGSSPAAADGFRTIVYQYHSALTGSAGSAAMPTGLYRLQTDALGLQVLLRQQEDQSPERIDESGVSMTTDPRLSHETLETLLLSPVTGNSAAHNDSLLSGSVVSDRPRLERIPEVVSCRFQYFDGERWLGEWDSGLRQSLPEAVRIRLRLASPDDVAELDQLTPSDDSDLLAAEVESPSSFRDTTAAERVIPSESPTDPWQNIRTRSYDFTVLLGLATPRVSLREGESGEPESRSTGFAGSETGEEAR